MTIRDLDFSGIFKNISQLITPLSMKQSLNWSSGNIIKGSNQDTRILQFPIQIFHLETF